MKYILAGFLFLAFVGCGSSKSNVAKPTTVETNKDRAENTKQEQMIEEENVSDSVNIGVDIGNDDENEEEESDLEK